MDWGIDWGLGVKILMCESVVCFSAAAVRVYFVRHLVVYISNFNILFCIISLRCVNRYYTVLLYGSLCKFECMYKYNIDPHINNIMHSHKSLHYIITYYISTFVPMPNLVAVLTTSTKRRPIRFSVLAAPSDAKYESTQTIQS